MVALKGSLANVSLLAVVQSIGEPRHTGTLHLTKGTATSRLAFDDGRLVAAECGDTHGLDAVAHCALDFGGAEYAFIEGTPNAQRTLDVGPADVTKLLTRITSSDFPATNGTVVADEHAEVACPHLGFADDPEHRYSRTTAMHRCYASGSAALVSAQDQRELCLSGRYTTCARFRSAQTCAPLADELAQHTPAAVAAGDSWNASSSAAASGAWASDSWNPASSSARPGAVASDPASPSTAAAQAGFSAGDPASPSTAAPRPAPLRAVPPPAARPQIPPGVAARLAAASQMQITSGPQPEPSAPPRPQPPKVVPPKAAQPPVADDPAARRSRAVKIATAVAAGLALLMLVGQLAWPAVRGRSTPRPAAAEPAENPTPAALAAPQLLASPEVPSAVNPPGVPTSQSLAAPPRQAAGAYSATNPSATSDPNSVRDVRFASGAADGWLDHQPYAGWSDGAYRLLASDAMRFVAVGVPIDHDLGDVILSATFRKTGGPPGGGYGLILRNQGPAPLDGVNQDFNAYVLETGDLGEYGVWRRDGDHWVDLVPWTPSSAVRSGGSPNDLLVRAVGNQLSFSVNGSVIAQVTDKTFAQGGVGVFVGGDDNAVALDRFNLELPD